MDQERPPTSLPSGPLVVDWHAHLLVQVTPDDGAFNSEHPVARDATLWTFDLCTNTWERRRGGLTTGALAYDAREDRIVIIGQASVTVYDLRTDTYEVRGSPPLSTPRFGAARSWRAVYDTERQRVLVLDKRSARVWSYDTAGDRWAVVGASGDRPPGREGGLELVAYDGSVDRLVLYAREGMRAQTFELDLATGTWSQPDIATPLVDFIYLDSGDEGIGYDPSSERTLVFSSGRVIAYDAHARAWAILYDEPPFDVSPASRPDAATTFDPVNRRLVVVGGWMGQERDDVIAFDPRSLSWSTLLEQSEP